jgi:hypothetical protein
MWTKTTTLDNLNNNKITSQDILDFNEKVLDRHDKLYQKLTDNIENHTVLQIDLEDKIKGLKGYLGCKFDQGTANYVGEEIREICGMVETLTTMDINEPTVIDYKKLSEEQEKLIKELKESLRKVSNTTMSINDFVMDECMKRKKGFDTSSLNFDENVINSIKRLIN